MTEVPIRLQETKCNRKKFPTDCVKQNAVDGSSKQIAGNKMQLKEVPNRLRETKRS
ncbi:hypothetical protein [Chryseobacterium luquanense]|uniref:Uncharacterized protein n=1 Tax=Chryseobacterium luquanense TaxID=2983766 RepID=A0ABT3XYZ9_9FLAO|nr:hypothetical protein [Chryseobacterium luquanense]MCX8531093.1 hypothetical protein [Chryseobacterium luquanense]